jgi:hypothetical protein
VSGPPRPGLLSIGVIGVMRVAHGEEVARVSDLRIGRHVVFVYILGLRSAHTILFSCRFYNVLYFYILFNMFNAQ